MEKMLLRQERVRFLHGFVSPPDLKRVVEHPRFDEACVGEDFRWMRTVDLTHYVNIVKEFDPTPPPFVPLSVFEGTGNGTQVWLGVWLKDHPADPYPLVIAKYAVDKIGRGVSDEEEDVPMEIKAGCLSSPNTRGATRCLS
jgi:hypothetical protein